MKSTVQSYAVLALTALTALGCAKSDNTKLEQVIQRRDESCLYDYNQGPSAAMTVMAPKMKTTYFGKQFDENKLKAISNVSGAETVRYAQMTGVTYYKTTYIDPAPDACAYAGALPSAPNQLINFFNKAGSGVLGVYLPQDFNGFADLAQGPAIMVRIDSDRWTLVHEYMHHLFSSLVTGALSDDQLKANYSKKMDNYKNKMSSAKAGLSTEQNYLLAVNSLNEGNGLLVELMKRFYLEEMTIEANLGDKFDLGYLNLVPSSMRLNGAAYTLSSAEKIKNLFSLHEDEIRKTREALTNEGSAKYSNEIKKLATDLDMFENIKTEMRPLVSKAMDYYYRHSLRGAGKSMAAIVSEIDKAPSAGCSHTRQGDEFLESAKSRFGKEE